MVCYSKAYWKRVSDRNRLRGKRAQQVIREKRLTQEIDADTMRQRAFYDRRGEFYAEVRKRTEAGDVVFTLRWSVCGRCDQLDIFDGATVLATCRPSLVLARIEEASR